VADVVAVLVLLALVVLTLARVVFAVVASSLGAVVVDGHRSP
jgi:hypothetical protein